MNSSEASSASGPTAKKRKTSCDLLLQVQTEMKDLEIEKLRGIVKNLVDQKSQTEKEIASIKNVKAEIAQTVLEDREETREKKEQLKAEILVLKKKTHEWDNHCKVMAQDHKIELQKQQETFELKMAEMKRGKAESDQKYQQLQSLYAQEKESSNRKINILNNELWALSTSKAEQASQLSAAEQKIAQLTNEMMKMDQAIKKASEEKQNIEDELEATKTSCTELKQKHDKMVDANVKLLDLHKNEYEKLKAEKKAVEKQLKAGEADCVDAKKCKDLIEQQMADQIEIFKRITDSYKAEILELNNENEKMKTRLQDAENLLTKQGEALEREFIRSFGPKALPINDKITLMPKKAKRKQ